MRLEKQTGTSDIGVSTGRHHPDLSPRISAPYALNERQQDDPMVGFLRPVLRRHPAGVSRMHSRACRSRATTTTTPGMARRTSSCCATEQGATHSPQAEPRRETAQPRRSHVRLRAPAQQCVRRGRALYLAELGQLHRRHEHFQGGRPESPRWERRMQGSAPTGGSSSRWISASRGLVGLGNYTYSRTRGNHFDWRRVHDARGLRRELPPDRGSWAVWRRRVPMQRDVPNLSAHPTFDRPHLIKLTGAYRPPGGPG